jgi:hypothetical protein
MTNVTPIAARMPLNKLVVPSPSDIRPRPWLLGYWMMRGAVTLIAAPGGTGKTSLLTSMILAGATGRDLIGAKPLKPLKVAFLGLEESEEEIHRRFAAAMMHYQIPPAEIDGQVYYLDGRSYQFSAAWMDDGGNVSETPQVAELTMWLQMYEIDLLFADPLALAHSAPENDNTAMARVLGIFSGIAAACDCGVGIIHHTRKGAVAGDPDGIRGAGALVNHARIALGLSPIDEEAREQFKLSKEDARGLVRIDDLKLNYSPKAAECRWVRLESVALGNKTEAYPYGDSIQVPVQWDPPDTESLFTPSIANECLDIIDKGLGTERYSASNASAGKAAFKVVQQIMRARGNDMSDAEARKIIKGWLTCNPPILREESYRSETERKHRMGLFVNNGNRP